MQDFVGFLLPPVIDLINRKVSDSDARFWVSVLFCILLGSLLVTVETNGFKSLSLMDASNLILAKSMTLFGMAQLSYKRLWEDSDVRDSMGLNAKTL